MNGKWYIDGGLTGNILLNEGMELCSNEVNQDDNPIVVDLILCSSISIPPKIPTNLLDFIKPIYNLIQNQLCSSKRFIKINMYQPIHDLGVNFVDFDQGGSGA